MKNAVKLLAAMHSIAPQIRRICTIAIAAVIGFSFIACDEQTNDNGTTTDTASFAGTWNKAPLQLIINGNNFTIKNNSADAYKGTLTFTGTETAGTISINVTHINHSGSWQEVEVAFADNGTYTAASNTFTISGLTVDGIALANGTWTKQSSGHSHSHSDTWSKDAAQHWKECSCGDKIEIANHSGNPCGVCGYNSGVVIPTVSYIINGSGVSFTATKNEATVGSANQTISNIITAIRADASNANVAIQFGDGTNVLDIGTYSVSFSNDLNNTWGNITISGKITSSSYVIDIGDVSVTSTADITSTYTTTEVSNRYAISISSYPSPGSLTIKSGTVSATGSGSANGISVSSGSTLTIDGGMVSVTNVNGNIGIYNRGTVIINNGNVSSMGNRAIYNVNNGTVTLNSGTVEAVSYIAIGNSDKGTITINGGTVQSTSMNAISNSEGGTVNVNNGTITRIVNEGALNMTGGTVTTSNTISPAISNLGGTVIISNGTVTAPNGGTAISNWYSGTVTITSPPAVITGAKEEM